MKLRAVLFSCLLLFSNIAFTEEGLKPFNWQPLGFTPEGKEGFYDKNRLRNLNDDGDSLVNSATVLIIFEKPKTIKISDDLQDVRSMVIVINVDCKEGTISPVVGIFYGMQHPTINDKSMGILRYTENEKGIDFEKTSYMITTLCPIRI